jgi:glycosyltransferase involved in cell wall biosynthesis
MRDLEFLISDNASTDATPEILASWAAKDPRIKYYRQPENIGAHPNFQWVLNAASSQWFAFAAHDDVWSPNFFQSLFDAVSTETRFVLAVPQIITFFENGGVDTCRPAPEDMGAGSRVDRIRRLLYEARGGWYYGLWDRQTLLSSIDKTRGFRHVWGSDLMILLPPILSGAVTSSNTAIYYKRLSPLSEQRYRPKTAKDELCLYSDFLHVSLESLKTAPLTPVEKLRLTPSVIRYARHGVKPSRILKTAIREVLRRK